MVCFVTFFPLFALANKFVSVAKAIMATRRFALIRSKNTTKVLKSLEEIPQDEEKSVPVVEKAEHKRFSIRHSLSEGQLPQEIKEAQEKCNREPPDRVFLRRFSSEPEESFKRHCPFRFHKEQALKASQNIKEHQEIVNLMIRGDESGDGSISDQEND